VRETPGVTRASPLIEQPLLATFNGRVEAVLVRGNLPEDIARLGDKKVLGNLDALQPGAQRVAVGSRLAQNLGARIGDAWPLPTALAFLAWFVFAPQCLSTIAVAKRETNGWKWPLVMLGYLFVLAYIAAGATYWIASAFGL